MTAVRVAIVGVGNCASALVQGIFHYRNAPDEGFIPGLMHPRLGGYHVGDIEFSAAFGLGAGTGLSMTLVRRFRELIWVAAGLVALSLFRVSTGAEPT